ncbi:MAG TPA: SDR family oxidoreductase [Bacteroidota bacterium]|nr:SDR family oxidoreductase [Bacteroidota bacterium]
MRERAADLRLRRPVVWVVGASRGIGREIAGRFAAIGCEVCLSSRNSSDLESAVRQIRRLGGRAHSFPCDIRKINSVSSTARRIRHAVGDVEVLVNNAGITVFKTFIKTSLKEFSAILDTNLLGQIASIKAVLPSMVRRRGGHIFNILSNAAIKTFEGSSAYTAAKAGMLGLGKVLREEVKAHHVKVVNILPGATETRMWSATLRKKYSYRMMKPSSVADAVLAVYRMPDDVVVDEMVIRPMLGDLGG